MVGSATLPAVSASLIRWPALAWAGQRRRLGVVDSRREGMRDERGTRGRGWAPLFVLGSTEQGDGVWLSGRPHDTLLWGAWLEGLSLHWR